MNIRKDLSHGAATLALVVLFGCGRDSTNVPLSRLEQASDIAPLCLATTIDDSGPIVLFDATPVPMSQCRAAINQRAKADLANATIDEDARTFGDDPILRCKRTYNDDSELDGECVIGALVTQISTGELAVIILDAPSRVNRQRFIVTLDNDDRVPGATFLRVGERPTAVVLDPEDPEVTYVASFGSRKIQAFDTTKLISGSIFDGNPDLTTDALIGEVQLDGGPTDLALHKSPQTGDEPGRGFLFAAIPGAGELVQVAIDESAGVSAPTPDGGMPMDASETLPIPNRASPFGVVNAMDTSLGMAVGAQVVAPPSDASDYNRTCATDFPQDEELRTISVQPRVPTTATSSEPVSLHIDDRHTESTADDKLLVADAAQPFIRNYDLGESGAVELPPLNTAVPTLAIATTPPVPAQVGETMATDRYLYAIDGTDGSVLAMDYEETSPSFGAVLPVRAGEQQDRLGFTEASRAISLAVITPGFNVDFTGSQPEDDLTENSPNRNFDNPLAECDPEDTNAIDRNDNTRAELAGALRLNGVFLTVGMTNGSIRIADVFDLDAPCRGIVEDSGSTECSEVPTTDGFVNIRRHRQRIQTRTIGAVDISSQPTLALNNNPSGIDPLGQANDLTLEPVTCPPFMHQVFPLAGVEEMITPSDPFIDARPRVCAASDVWSTRAEAWRVEWEGIIDATSGGLGRFTGTENRFIAEDAVFCTRGVLGALDVTASRLGADDPERGYAGDMLVITGELPPTTENDANCAQFIDNEENTDDAPVGFLIREARQNELVLGAPIRGGFTLASVRACFPDFMEYEIRVNDAYAVTGELRALTDSGFLHRVAALGPEGQCRVDLTRPINVNEPDTYLNARAFPGRVFTNPSTRFQVGPFDLTALADRNGNVPASVSDLPADTEAELRFSLENNTFFIFMDTRSLPSGRAAGSQPIRLKYFPSTNSLFIVDPSVGVGRAPVRLVSSPGRTPYDILLQ